FHSLMTAGYFRPQAATNSTNRAREASSVAHEHAHICDTAVLNLGEHVHPVLRALPAVPGPTARGSRASPRRSRPEPRRSGGSPPERPGPLSTSSTRTSSAAPGAVARPPGQRADAPTGTL